MRVLPVNVFGFEILDAEGSILCSSELDLPLRVTFLSGLV